MSLVQRNKVMRIILYNLAVGKMLEQINLIGSAVFHAGPSPLCQ